MNRPGPALEGNTPPLTLALSPTKHAEIQALFLASKPDAAASNLHPADAIICRLRPPAASMQAAENACSAEDGEGEHAALSERESLTQDELDALEEELQVRTKSPIFLGHWKPDLICIGWYLGAQACWLPGCEITGASGLPAFACAMLWQGTLRVMLMTYCCAARDGRL